MAIEDRRPVDAAGQAYKWTAVRVCGQCGAISRDVGVHEDRCWCDGEWTFTNRWMKEREDA